MGSHDLLEAMEISLEDPWSCWCDLLELHTTWSMKCLKEEGRVRSQVEEEGGWVARAVFFKNNLSKAMSFWVRSEEKRKCPAYPPASPSPLIRFLHSKTPNFLLFSPPPILSSKLNPPQTLNSISSLAAAIEVPLCCRRRRCGGGAASQLFSLYLLIVIVKFHNSSRHPWAFVPVVASWRGVFRGNGICSLIVLFGLLAHGAGWHNNHHAFDYSARQGLEWWQIDTTWYLIQFLQTLGLATKVKLPTEAQKKRKALYNKVINKKEKLGTVGNNGKLQAVK